MWTTFPTLIVLLIPLLWYLFSLGTNSYIRGKAQEHPDSWMYLYITLFDQVLKVTLFRPAQGLSTAPKEEVPTDAAYEETDKNDSSLNQAFNAEYAVQILFDPTVKIPKKILALIRPQTLIIISFVLVFMVSASVTILVSQFVSRESALGIFIIVFVALSVFIPFSGEWGPFKVALNLHINPFLLVIATKRNVFLHSSWMPRTQIANRNFKFSASDGQFMSNLLVLRDKQTPSIIFSYPTYFDPYVLLEGGLPVLAERLNRLIEIARQAPDLDPDKPLFGQVPLSQPI